MLVTSVYPHCDFCELNLQEPGTPTGMPSGQNVWPSRPEPHPVRRLSYQPAHLPSSCLHVSKPYWKEGLSLLEENPLRDKVFQSLAYMGSTFVKRVCTGLNFAIISVFVEMPAIPASGLFRLAGSRVVFSTGISRLLKNITFFYPDRGVLQGG